MNAPDRRATMVDAQLARRGVRDPRVLAAFAAVPREAFTPPALRASAYADAALPIAAGQTISQPYIVAVTAAALELKGPERVLEVGTGSGYAAAILERLCREVHTVERLPALAESASVRLEALGLHHVHVHLGDGSLGWPAAAPYEGIAVAAAAPEVPPALLDQLAIGGRLVVPVGADPEAQQLVRVTRLAGGGFREERLAAVRFVPLIGAQGFAADRGDPADA